MNNEISRYTWKARNESKQVIDSHSSRKNILFLHFFSPFIFVKIIIWYHQIYDGSGWMMGDG
jgi:hypothetical protein